MNIKKRIILPSLALLLVSNLYAGKIYIVETTSLKDAISKISKISGIPYLVDTAILKDKKSKKIKNIEGLDNALKAILKGTGLEAIVKNNMIMIKKIAKTKDSTNLDDVDVIENLSNVTEGSGSYTIQSMSTSTKMNLSLRETPQSILVLTNEQIQDKNLESLEDLTKSLNGVQFASEGSDRPWVTSRGFYLDYYQLDGMATTFDGFSSDQNLIMYDRVEVVKGANGLTSGAGNPAASLNFVRKHANDREFSANLTLKAGSWNTYGATVDITTPLTKDGKIRARIVAHHKDEESYLNFYSKKTDLFYGIVDADLGDNTSVFAGMSYNKTKAKGSTWGGLPSIFSDNSYTNFSTSDSFVPSWTKWDKNTTTVFSGIEHIFSNDIKLKVNYTYMDIDSNPLNVNLNGYPDQVTGLGLNITRITSISHQSTAHILDTYASIPFELGNQEHELVIGYSYSKYNERKFYAEDNFTSTAMPSIYSWNTNISKPTFGDYGLDSETSISQSALYTVGKFNILDNLTVITGARITNYTNKCIYDWWSCSDNYENKNVLTPYAGIIYDLDKKHSIYSSYTSIFNAQSSLDKSGNQVGPKEGNSYEIGIKGEYFEKRLNSSIAYFNSKLENVASKSGEYILGTMDDAYYGIDGVTAKGIELALNGEITDNWNIDLGLSYLSTKNVDGVDINTTTPKKEISFSTKYKIGKLSFGGGVNWQDKIYNDIKNASSDTVRLTQDSFSIVNAMSKYEFNKDLSVQLNIDNLFNKKYYQNIYWNGQIIFGNPRKTTITLNYKF